MPTGVYNHEHARGRTLIPPEELRERILAASLELLAEGRKITQHALRERGIRGTNSTLLAHRDALVAAGLLPATPGSRARESEAVASPGQERPAETPPPFKPRRERREVSPWVKLYGVERMRREFGCKKHLDKTS